MSSILCFQDDSMTVQLDIKPVRSTDSHVSYVVTIDKTRDEKGSEKCSEKGSEKIVKTGELPILNPERNLYEDTHKDVINEDDDNWNSPIFRQFEAIFRRIDQSKFATQRADNILELLHLCTGDGLPFIRKHSRLRSIVWKRCNEYSRTAKKYQHIVEEASRTILLLIEPSATATATATTPSVSYDPNAHHC